MSARKALGKGLGALIPGAEEGFAAPQEHKGIPVERIVPNRFQPRMGLDEEAIARLADSIREQGVLEPLIVRPAAPGTGADYELVAGERRWRAARKIGLERVPAIIKELSDRQALEMALTENLQREDLNPVEEARAYQMLKKEFGLTQEDISKHVGVERSTVANSLRLLNLEKHIQEDIAKGIISPGHARALLALKGPERERLRLEIAQKSLTVRQAELRSRDKTLSAGHKAGGAKGRPFDDALEVMSERLARALGTKVKIRLSARGGRIEIRFKSRDEMEGIFDRILGS